MLEPHALNTYVQKLPRVYETQRLPIEEKSLNEDINFAAYFITQDKICIYPALKSTNEIIKNLQKAY